MICPSCNTENKDDIKVCKKCDASLEVTQNWMPSWRWHLRALGIIYVGLIIIYFAMSAFLNPYLRQLPKETRPWLFQDQAMHQK